MTQNVFPEGSSLIAAVLQVRFQDAVSSELATCCVSKFSKMMEPSTLRVNQNDLPLVRRRRGSDTYCWICHTSIHLKDDYLCNRCGRSFHYFCNEQSKEALPPAFSNYELNSRLPCCPVCQHTNDAAFQYAPSELPELNKALSYVCEQLKKIENSNYFLYPVDEKVYPKYREVIVNPMALKVC